MFTGIVQSTGRVIEFDGASLTIEAAAPLGPDPIQIGESIAVSGSCLTAVEAAGTRVRFDVSPETLARTTLGSFKPGAIVNLERAMRADGRFGGHIVQGHVDATGEVVSIRPVKDASVYRFRVPESAAKYLIDKGSIAVDGISLTVVTPDGNEFDTWIIPHTLEHTSLKGRREGDRVNLEYDVLARYAERLRTTIS